MSRFKAVRIFLCPLLLALLGGGGGALPARAQPAYAVAGVKVVSGGQPVAGVEDGILFSRRPEADCRPLPGSASPLAAALTSSAGSAAAQSAIGIEVSLIGCGESALPAVACSWEIEETGCRDRSSQSADHPATSGPAQWQGLEGRISVPLPARTGSYELRLRCEAGGELAPPEVRSRLFVTYGEPLAVVSPPQADWYQRATCWSAGRGAGDSEAEVLEALLAGMYRHGREHWRYGYARSSETDGLYHFPISDQETVPYRVEDPTLRPTCQRAEKCLCSWPALVATGSGCSFSDCYHLSDAFHAMAAVMGVGGLRYYSLRGKAQAGVVTEPKPSLDPAHPGNVSAQDLGDLFVSHSLRLRDGLYYDATYGSIYQREYQSVRLHSVGILRVENPEMPAIPVVRFLDSNRRLYSLGRHYGGWKFYGDRPSAGRQEAFAGPPITFPAGAHFEGVDLSGIGVYSQLRVKLELALEVAGEYLLQGVLRAASGSEITRRPNWWTSQPTTAVLESARTGRHTVELSFSGHDIFSAGSAGPYFVQVWVDAVENPTASYQVCRPSEPLCDPARYGELAVAIQGKIDVAPIDSDGNGRLDSLRIEFPLSVRMDSVAAVEARLAKDAATVGYAGGKQDYKARAEPYEVLLEMPGGRIAELGRDGPYDLTVVLYHLGQAVSDEYLANVGSGWKASSFERPGGRSSESSRTERR